MAHAGHKPVSDAGILVQGITGFAIAVLVMLGVGGSIYYVAVVGSMPALVALLVVGLYAWLSRRWVSPGGRNRHSEFFVYGFAAVGAIYAYQIFTRGGL